MKTWTPYHQNRAGGGSDLRQDDDFNVKPLKRSQAKKAQLTVVEMAGYDVEDSREFMEILGLLPDLPGQLKVVDDDAPQ